MYAFKDYVKKIASEHNLVTINYVSEDEGEENSVTLEFMTKKPLGVEDVQIVAHGLEDYFKAAGVECAATIILEQRQIVEVPADTKQIQISINRIFMGLEYPESCRKEKSTWAIKIKPKDRNDRRVKNSIVRACLDLKGPQ
jgi:hypothetical protein